MNPKTVQFQYEINLTKDGKVLTYKSGSYFLGAGTLMAAVMW